MPSISVEYTWAKKQSRDFSMANVNVKAFVVNKTFKMPYFSTMHVSDCLPN